MRFVDSNVFLYAILKPRRQLTNKEEERKAKAREIYDRIDGGEEVMTSTVHLSEVANVLEEAAGLRFSIDFTEALLRKGNVRVEGVTRGVCVSACVQAKRNDVGVNDAIAYMIMVQNNVREIYSFDRHFDRLDIVRVES
ncbi:MAG: type II toxin-antitoxin system VapC family toxin [Candidatus Bathyarchaeia archaeon]